MLIHEVMHVMADAVQPFFREGHDRHRGGEFLALAQHLAETLGSDAGLDADLCTSFSGLKTALLNYVKSVHGADSAAPIPDIPRICASYQRAIVASIADRTSSALKRRPYRALIVGGGVSLNKAKVGDIGAEVTAADIINGHYSLAQKGKKNYYITNVK